MRVVLPVFGVLGLLVVGLIVLARVTVHSIAGVSCDPGEGSAYHIHSYLTIVDRGVRHHPPAGIGIQYQHLCLYWIHTHDASGIIHIEAPHGFRPTLGQFFAIWGEPLSPHAVDGFTVSSGTTLRTYVGRRAFSGNPRSIRLTNHRSITIEVGPPFVPPVAGNFHGL